MKGRIIGSLAVLSIIILLSLISAYPYEINTAVYNNQKLSFNEANNNSPFGFYINDAGSRLYVLVTTNNAVPVSSVNEYNISSFEIQTAVYIRRISLPVAGVQYLEISFKPDGNSMFISTNYGEILQYTLSNAWNISSAIFNTSKSIGRYFSGMYFSPDGLELFLGSNSPNYRVYHYNLGTAWNIQTVVNDTSIPVFNPAWSLFFKPDGFVMYEGSSIINQYRLGNAWDITTATFEHQVDFMLYGFPGLNLAMQMDTNGNKMYLSGRTSGSSTVNDGIYQFNMDAIPQRLNNFSSGEISSAVSYFISGYYTDYLTFNVSWFDTSLNSTQTISKSIGEGSTTISGDIIVTLDGILNPNNILFKLTPLNETRTVNFTVRAINNKGYDEQQFWIQTEGTPEFLAKGLFSTVIKGFTDIFPDKDTLGSSEKFAYALFIMIITVVAILVVGKESISLALILASVISIMEFIYFVFIGYISIGIVIILVLIGIVLTYFKFRGV